MEQVANFVVAYQLEVTLLGIWIAGLIGYALGATHFTRKLRKTIDEFKTLTLVYKQNKKRNWNIVLRNEDGVTQYTSTGNRRRKHELKPKVDAVMPIVANISTEEYNE